jgi:CRISPR system Cascade subunit CasE
MSEINPLYAAVLKLSRTDIKALKITDAYSLHRVIYDLYDDMRTEQQKQESHSSGILYVDKGGDFNHRLILMLANRQPNTSPAYGEVEYKIIPDDFLQHQYYAFEATVNPCKRDNKTGKIIPIRERENIAQWFIDRASSSWGFTVNPTNLQVEKLTVQTFTKNNQKVTHGSATLKGELKVANQAQFIQCFQQGIGRGRAFGFGLLQIVKL